MKFNLVDSGWAKLLDQALAADCSTVRIVCPFIKLNAARNLLSHGNPGTLKVITRFNLDEFAAGVSDISALRLLIGAGARIRGIKHLHAKLYLIGCSRVILTSANLTDAALRRNHEFGVEAEEPAIFNRCAEYFEGLWRRAGSDLVSTKLDSWDRRVLDFLRKRPKATLPSGLGDEGSDAGMATEPIIVSETRSNGQQAFVKFFGTSQDRGSRSQTVIDELNGSGAHWACPYPLGKRPRVVPDGAVMFMGLMVGNPNDTLVYGRAIGSHYVPGRDDATAADIRRKSWRANWPHYIRVDDGEFVKGTVSNGVSLNELMEALGSDSFVPTQTNARRKSGNTNPRRAYLKQAAVHLTDKSFRWLNSRLERAFEEHGKIPAPELARLYRPKVNWNPEQ